MYSRSTKSRGPPMLHGHLIVKVHEAKDLPNMEGFLSTLVSKNDVTDPFVEIVLGSAKIGKTKMIANTLNPVWNESFRIELCHFGDFLTFEVKDKDHVGADTIGKVEIATASLMNGEVKERWFPIINKRNKAKGQLRLFLQFVSKFHTLHQGYEVDCYFPVHRNCLVTLYQDAHCPQKKPMPQFDSMPFRHRPPSCWNDIYYALMEARHLICIIGWSVWHELQLLRGEEALIDQRTLGQILVDKANEGVSVYVMIWDDASSSQLLGTAGAASTNDEATYDFFRPTKVNIAKVAREIDFSKDQFWSDVGQATWSKTYSHHQKSVVCDAAGPGVLRRLVAFVGGIDLTNGRYDTPDHELYSTLMEEHVKDFHNNFITKPQASVGPREPWHDIHSKVEGPIAQDVFTNFHERWRKQCRNEVRLDPLDPNIFDLNCLPPFTDYNKRWCCQLFRSINDDSADLDSTKSFKLTNKKGRLLDTSIQQAYIQMIRGAQNFIYLESQFFMGSAFSWLKNDQTSCDHIVPAEIAQKVVEKIHNGERFVAYIVIPMFPEGDPGALLVQEQLYWQTRTIEMMYKRIGEAIKETGNGTHPTDWLIFLCPAKREKHGPHIDRLKAPTDPKHKKLRETLRYPIYVHSKMMVVDDSYVIIGSANMNQRSMAGSRDTEICVGSWQPAFPPDNPCGDVHIFRLSLFVEHFRYYEEVFERPGSWECIQRVKFMAEHNWKMYNGENGSSTTGQIVTYPLKVSQDGALSTLPNFECFPDFEPTGKILGTMSNGKLMMSSDKFST